MSSIYFIFSVEGQGSFPHDMLRYDRAEFYSAVDKGTADATMITREIMLWSHRPPTYERWESFGWKVITEQEWDGDGYEGSGGIYG